MAAATTLLTAIPGGLAQVPVGSAADSALGSEDAAASSKIASLDQLPRILSSTAWEALVASSLPTSFKGRPNRNRWSDEIRITGEHIPLDYATDVQPFLQPILNIAQASGKRVIMPDTGNRYLPLGAPLSVTPGAQRAGASAGVPSGAILKDSSNVPLKNNVRIEGNNCTLVPLFSGFAIDIVPSMSLAEMADPANVGCDSAQLDIRNFNFNLNGAPGAQALRLGRQGRSFHDLVYYSKIHGISLNNVGGANTAPADHGIRLEGYLYGLEAEGWRLNAIGGGLWMVIDSTAAGVFQGAFFFKNFQSLGNQARPPLRMSVLAGGVTGNRSEIRGLHFNDSQIYGPGTKMEAVGNANIGDVWFGSGCQWDPVFGVPTGSGEPAIAAVAAQGGKIFNNFWVNPYIQYFNGPAFRAVTDSNGTSLITNQQFRGGSYTLINNAGGGLFDLQGLHAGGLKLYGLDFQGCQAASYVVANNADSVLMNSCTSDGETVGDSNITAGAIATSGSVRRITAIGNNLKAGVTTSIVTGPGATAQLAPNTVNLLY